MRFPMMLLNAFNQLRGFDLKKVKTVKEVEENPRLAPPLNRWSSSDVQNVCRRYLHGKDYASSTGVPRASTFSSPAFDDYDNQRIKDSSALTTKTPSGVPLNKILADKSTDAAACQAVAEDIKNALKGSQSFSSQKDIYQGRIGTFDQLLAQVPKKYKVSDLRDTMKFAVDEGRKAIQDQQTAEIKNLEEKFKDANFQKNLKKALNIKDEQIEQVKNDVIKDLKEKHKQHLDTFDKSTQESLTNIDKSSQKDLDDFLFIANLYNYGNKEMRKIIDDIAQTQQNAGNLAVSLNKDKASIHNVKLEQLPFIRLMGGQKIKPEIDQQTKQPISPPVYTLSMNRSILNPYYYFMDKNKDDIMALAQTIKATGSKTITFNLEFDDEEVALKRGRQAFEAALKSGFKPEDIKINVNGQALAYTAGEKDGQKYESIAEKLFAGKGQVYSQYLQAGKQAIAQYDAMKKTGPSTNSGDMKKEMEHLRQKGKSKDVEVSFDAMPPSSAPAA